MNANELADALQGSCPYGLDEAARMLRQQQAEIEALKEQLEIVSTNLRNGISKSIQKAQARAIDETLDDWKRTREYCS
jgi:hypothetical protein